MSLAKAIEHTSLAEHVGDIAKGAANYVDQKVIEPIAEHLGVLRNHYDTNNENIGVRVPIKRSRELEYIMSSKKHKSQDHMEVVHKKYSRKRYSPPALGSRSIRRKRRAGAAPAGAAMAPSRRARLPRKKYSTYRPFYSNFRTWKRKRYYKKRYY